MKKLIIKAGEDTLIDFEMAPVLRKGDTITGTPTVAAVPSDLTIGSIATDNSTLVQARISGGTVKTSYEVTVTVATAGGDTRKGVFDIYVDA